MTSLVVPQPNYWGDMSPVTPCFGTYWRTIPIQTLQCLGSMDHEGQAFHPKMFFSTKQLPVIYFLWNSANILSTPCTFDRELTVDLPLKWERRPTCCFFAMESKLSTSSATEDQTTVRTGTSLVIKQWKTEMVWTCRTSG